MRNIFIIGLIVVSMGYMFSILFDRYNKIIEEEENKKALQLKKQMQQQPQQQKQ